jgi:cob(I)alamin adenosyltransferase
MPSSKGLVEIFTGDGKGKTSAALGVVLRALGHGFRVHIVYFMKGEYPYGEQQVLSRLPNVSFSRFGHEHFVDPAKIKPEEREQAEKALEKAREVMLSGQYDLVVLDEVNIAVAWGLVGLEQVLELLREKPERVELILTGRHAPPELIQRADLVTEMVEIKHPYHQGVLSRRGIDY